MTIFTVTWHTTHPAYPDEVHVYSREELRECYPHFAGITEEVNGLDDFAFEYRRNDQRITITAKEQSR
jgi:uncharacterized protein YdcH (DUF465 family)